MHADVREPEQVDPATLERYDVIGFGSGIFWWTHHARLRRFIEGLPQVDGIAAFVFTTAHMGRSQSLPCQPALDAMLRRKGYDVVGSFACEGTDPWMPQRLIPGLYRAHPDDRDLERARQFADQVAAVASHKHQPTNHTYPQLTHLAWAYFHQDYDLDAPTPAGIIATFADGEEPGATRELAAEIGSILDSGMTETQIAELWITTLHASYEPARDGLTYRAWLITVLDAPERT